jgi:prepilin-type N-terminal cleavage/methylation domain-containing protein
MKRHHQGFTLIELILTLTIFGVIGVMAIPHYLDASAQALIQAKWDKSGEVKAIHGTVTAVQQAYPSVQELAAQLPGEGAKARANGITLQIDGEAYTIPTYSNALCTRLTQSAEDAVGCVGTIPS